MYIDIAFALFPSMYICLRLFNVYCFCIQYSEGVRLDFVTCFREHVHILYIPRGVRTGADKSGVQLLSREIPKELPGIRETFGTPCKAFMTPYATKPGTSSA